jgi:uncharacterized protein (TIGR02996 family)
LVEPEVVMRTRVIVPDPAAVLEGEGEMLAAVTANLADHTSKLVYADWLEERDDPRGPFLREFVQAAQGGRPLPTADGLSAGWCETVGLLLVGRIRKFDLEPYQDRLLTLARPVLELNDVTLTAERSIPPGGSKLGGRPALPRRTPWPRCGRGPLKFFAQFDLADLHPTTAGRALPAAGLLSFFTYQNMEEDRHGDPRVIFTPPGADLGLLDPPGDLDENLGRPGRPATFTVRESLDLPAATEPWEGRLGFPNEAAADHWEVRDRYWELLLAQRDLTHVLFGYARPRHLVCDPIPGPEWEQLISLKTDDDLGWGWGDGHELFWYIPTADLKTGRFDRTVEQDG